MPVDSGVRGDLIKIIWHDGIGMSLYAKRLERGRFLWPSPADGTVGISASQLDWPICSMASTGETRVTPGGRGAPDKVGKLDFVGVSELDS